MAATIDRPEPRAGADPGPVGAPEAVEDVAQGLVVEPRAVVAHDDRGHGRCSRAAATSIGVRGGGVGAGRWPPGWRSAWRRWSWSPEHHDRGRSVEGDRPPGIGGHGVAAGVGGQHREVDRAALERPGLVQSGQQQQVLDEHLHAGRLLLDAAQDDRQVHVVLLAADPEQLGEALDRGERRAQLVGGVGQELAQPLLGGLALVERVLDLAEHRVERQAELTDLGAVVGRARPAGTGRRR